MLCISFKGFIKYVLVGLVVLNCSQRGAGNISEQNEEVLQNSDVEIAEEEVVEQAEEAQFFYRDAMREFVLQISEHAKKVNPKFAVIPQNGMELVTLDGTHKGALMTNYLNAIDGNGQESLLYGEPNDNSRTSTDRTNYLTGLLTISQSEGNTILITDYCRTESKVNDALESNQNSGFIPFAADERNLTSIPSYPQEPFNVNASDALKLADARNHMLLLNSSEFETKESFLNSLDQTNYDILIIDAFYNDGKQFTIDDINRLKTKKNGGKRMVISYMSIGEAEDYRYYWDLNWEFEPPVWLGEENPRWKGNYKVLYWNKDWQDLIISKEDSYLNRILNSGFDGVYMDIIDGFDYFENIEDSSKK